MMGRVNFFAALPAVGSAIMSFMYFRFNPTPSVFAAIFLAVVTGAAAAAIVSTRSSWDIGFLTFVAAACFAFGMLTPSWLGFLLLAVAILSILAVIGTLIFGRGTDEGRAVAMLSGGAGGLLFLAVLWSMAVLAAV
jgi:hypothetical protein